MKRIVLGPHAVRESLRVRSSRRDSSLHVIYVEPNTGQRLNDLESIARAAKVPVEVRSRVELDRLAKGARHQGVVAIGGSYDYRSLDSLLREASRPAYFVATDHITDPHNFGAIIRSAVAFALDGIITTKDRAATVTSATVRASAGGTEHAKIARVTNLKRCLLELREQGFQVVGLAGDGDTALSAVPTISDDPESTAGRVVVVGSEGRGLRRLVREACTLCVNIPMDGPMESLNAAVAAGVAMYALRPHHRESMLED